MALSETADHGSVEFAKIKDHFREQFNLRLSKLGIPVTGSGRINEVRKLFSISAPTAQKWVSGLALPDISSLIRICQTFKCSLDDLLFGLADIPSVTQTLKDAILVDAKDRRVGKKISIESESNRLSDFPDTCAIYEVSDNCMDPYVTPGDFVVVNLSLKDLSRNQVMMFRNKDRYFLRRTQSLISGGISLVSENPRYSSEKMSQDTFIFDTAYRPTDNHVVVIGEVIARLLIQR